MSARPNLRLVDSNGELVETNDPQETIKALQAALVREQKVSQGLRARMASERKNYIRRGDVEAIFEEWQEKLHKKRSKLTDDRFDAIKGLLEKDYTREHFSLVIDALAAFPYVVYGKRRPSGAKDSLEVDIGYACERGRRFEELAVLGSQIRRIHD